jgi:hypothetical protein
VHKSKIFLVGDDPENLITLEETGYMTEGVLQDHLVNYPDLLPGDQIDPENPRRWLLVAQEMGVPGEEEGGSRWSLDHLFLDQDGIPTFVECKRSTDTRTRREVVAQMLDYAANGVEYWSMERLRQAAAETAQKRGRSLDDEITGLVDIDEEDIEGYWDTVEINLKAHRVRLVFVADSTPKELRRLVEFLNEEMTNVEVLAVEVKQFQRESREDQTALVPRVVGMTEAAREKRSAPRRGRMTYQKFFAECTPAGGEFFQRVLELAGQRGHDISWSEKSFSVRTDIPGRDGQITFLQCVPRTSYETETDILYFVFGYIKNILPPDETAALRERLVEATVLSEWRENALRAPVTRENLEAMNSAYDLILDEIDQLIESCKEREETE